MKFAVFAIVAFISLLGLPSSAGLECLHLGTLNPDNTCNCFPSFYSGTDCGDLDCSAAYDDTSCGDLLLDPDVSCVDSSNQFYELARTLCPRQCQVCDLSTCTLTTASCLNQGTFNQAACSCTCSDNYEGQLCQTERCLNGGNFEVSSDRCYCQPFPYDGPRCEHKNCDLAEDAAECLGFTDADCYDGIGDDDEMLQTLCPIVCEICTCQKTASSCQNGGTFHADTCTCECPLQYTGMYCQTRRCQHGGFFVGTPDTGTCTCEAIYTGANCETLICDNAMDVSECPNMGIDICGIIEWSDLVAPCPFTGSNVCPIDPSLSWRCPIMCATCTCTKNCGAHGSLDTQLCKCNCMPSWTGVTCDTRICTDYSACTGLNSESCANPDPIVESVYRLVDVCPVLCQWPTCQPPPPPSCDTACYTFGGYVDANTCNCTCYSNYEGTECDQMLPCSLSEDHDICYNYVDFCGNAAIDALCPVTCLTCPT